MESFILYALILLGTFLAFKPAYGAITIRPMLNTGLVGYWSFEEGSGTQAGDSSGNGNNGTITGATWTDGKRGNALSFDGTNDYVDADNVGDGIKTISFWVKPSTLTNRIIDMNGTAKVELSNGTITTTGITSPTIYIDGVATSAIDTNWHYVTIKTDAPISATSTKLGGPGDSWQCGNTLSYCGDNYATVQMTSTYGGQCWLQENLRNTTKPDCTTAITNYCDPAGCDSPWGRLYNNATTMNGDSPLYVCGAKIQGICPNGWHLPSDYDGCSNDDFPGLGPISGGGGALKKTGTTEWASPNTGATNDSGWTAYPAGYYSGGSFIGRGSNSFFWSSLGTNYRRFLYNNNADWGRNNNNDYGFSVRCVKDVLPKSYFSGKLDEVRMYNRALAPAEISNLYTASKKKISYKVAANNGLVGYWSFDEGSGTQAGDSSGNRKNGTVYSSTTPAASWANGKRGQALSFDGSNDYIDAGNVGDGIKTISFWVKTSTLTNRVIDLNGTAKVELSNGTITTNGITSPTIYIDGVATSTIDANWHHVTIKTDTGINASAAKIGQGDPACGDALVDSRDGKSYATVWIATSSQCWIKQSMNIGMRVNGGTAQGTTCTNAADIEKWCYSDSDANCDSNNNPNYPDGALYQWNQMMCGAASCNGTGESQPGCVSPIQGICPSGWHIPSHYEITALERAVCTSGSCATDFPYDTTAVGWRGTDESSKLMPGGSSGWEGNLAGFYQVAPGGFYSRASEGFLWSSTQYDSTYAWWRSLYPGFGVWRGSWDGFFRTKAQGYLVRCLKDTPPAPFFSGKLDEVRFYNRALSAAEVAGLYQASGRKATINSSQNTQLTTGLVGLWSFNGPDVAGAVAYDRSGQNNHGTISGAVPTIGKVGQALSFDGTGDSVAIPASTSIDDLATATVSMWFKVSSDGDLLVKDPGDTSALDIYIYSDRRLLLTRKYTGQHMTRACVAGSFQFNQWTHLAIVYGGRLSSNAHIYIDSSECSYLGQSDGADPIMTEAGKPLVINSASAPTVGKIDEVRFYNRTLSAAEVKRLYEMGR